MTVKAHDHRQVTLSRAPLLSTSANGYPRHRATLAALASSLEHGLDGA